MIAAAPRHLGLNQGVMKSGELITGKGPRRRAKAKCSEILSELGSRCEM